MKKIFRVKSSNAVTCQVLGIAGVILATFISFAYLMPESSTSSETVTSTVIETTTVSSAVSQPVITSTTTKTVTKVSTKSATSSVTSTTAEVTSTATTSMIETTTSSYVTTAFSETSATTSAPEVTETTTADLESSLYDWSDDYVAETFVTENSYNEATLVFTEPSGNDSDADENEEEKQPEGVYLGRYKITHYCACSECCGEYTGLTASGTVATAGRTASASSEFEFGTKVEIDGNVYVIEDRGGFSENTIDIFCDSHQEALEKGSYYTDVYIIYDDEDED